MRTIKIQRVTVYGYILNDRNEFLLVKRAAHDSRPGLWEIPGGSLEINETIEEGIMREVKEETGLTVIVQKPLAVMATHFTKEKNKLIQTTRIAFLCRLIDTRQQVRLSRDHSQYAWATQDRLGDKHLSDFLVYVLEQVA